MKPDFKSLFLLLMLLVTLVIPASTAVAGTQGPISDIWRSGVQVNASSIYSAVIGRARSPAANFSSAAGEGYFIIEAPARAVMVRNASVRILSQSGSYSGTAGLTLEVHSMNGTFLRSLVATGINLQTASTAHWIELNLANPGADCIVQPGEELLLHMKLSGAPGDTLAAVVLFEVAASDLPYPAFLTTIRRN